MILTNFSLIKSPLTSFIECVRKEFANELNKVRFTEISAKEFNKLRVGKKVPCFLVYQLKSNPDYLLFSSNLIDGWYTLLYSISKKHKIELIRIQTYLQNNENEPCYTFNYIKNGEERFVTLYKESNKWVFYEKGEPLGFENLELYREKLKKKRLSNEIIFGYLEKIGNAANSINFEDDSNGKMVLFESFY